MAWTQEKTIYISKLRNIIDAITEIKKLEGNRIITKDILSQLDNLSTQAQILLPKLEKDEFEIAVVGVEKAGKSSFTNAFIGLDVLPTDDQRCTYTSTCIRAGNKDHATVTFYTKQEFDRDFSEKLRLVGIENAQQWTIDNLNAEIYQELFNSCETEKKHRYENTLHQDIIDTIKNKQELQKYIGTGNIQFSNSQLLDEQFRNFITKPSHAIAVKNVSISSKKLESIKNIIMHDVPGFNSPTEMHREQTKQKMESADAIIMIAKADEPSITSDVLKIFKETDTDGILLAEKLFIFANKADRATDLEKNKQVTYEEWISKRKILPDTNESRDRIIFGSATAHLGEKVKSGLEARNALEKQGIPDGIECLWEKLKQYQETERFSVLKKRINLILSNIEKLFKDTILISTANDQEEHFEYYKVVLELRRRLSTILKEKLNDLKMSVNTEAKQNRPLTAKIETYIKENITPEKYTITDEEIDKKHKELAGIGSAEQPQKLDGDIRETRFRRMYDDFTKNMLLQTTSEHKNICTRIQNIFVESINIDRYSGTDATVINEIDHFCAYNNIKDDEYYKSLIERFARDLFEIQIKFSYGADRLNKFREEAAIFFSLGVFYNYSITKHSENTLFYIKQTPETSLFWKLLLYPNPGSITSKTIEQIKKLTGMQEILGTMTTLLENIINIYSYQTTTILEKAFENFCISQPAAVVCSTAKQILEDIINDADNNTSVFLESILTGNRYQEDIAIKHKDYSYKQVQNEFKDDIQTLRNVLLNAFIPASNIDKAFSARETKLIEDIIDKIDGNDFENFIAKNAARIEAAKIGALKEAEGQREIDKKVASQIKSILTSISAIDIVE